jgi:hypothetical protein
MAAVASAKRVFDIHLAMFFPLFRAARLETWAHSAADITFAQSGNKIYIEPMGRASSFCDAAMRHLTTIRDGVAVRTFMLILPGSAPRRRRRWV